MLSSTEINKATLRLPLMSLIGQTSNSIVFNINTLLVYQTVLVTISRIILHFDVVNKSVWFTFLLFSLNLLSSSVWRLVCYFWAWKDVHTINWLIFDVWVVSIVEITISTFTGFSWFLGVLSWLTTKVIRVIVSILRTVVNSITTNKQGIPLLSLIQTWSTHLTRFIYKYFILFTNCSSTIHIYQLLLRIIFHWWGSFVYFIRLSYLLIW